MITFLFWNLKEKLLQHRVARIADRFGVDVVLLAECSVPEANLLASLNGGRSGSSWTSQAATLRRLKLLTRLPAASVAHRFTEVAERMVVYEIRSASAPPFLLAGVHLPSKRNWKDKDHTSWIHFFVDDLQRVEGPQPGRVVLVGDLNMDPFDDAVVGGFGLHALPTRRDAEWRMGRVVQSRESGRTFFNPMWGLLGEPAGTFYRSDSVPVTPFWHTLDQVLLRPALADKLVSIRVLGHDGGESLIHPEHGWPDTNAGSDHLPILFTLKP